MAFPTHGLCEQPSPGPALRGPRCLGTYRAAELQRDRVQCVPFPDVLHQQDDIVQPVSRRAPPDLLPAPRPQFRQLALLLGPLALRAHERVQVTADGRLRHGGRLRVTTGASAGHAPRVALWHAPQTWCPPRGAPRRCLLLAGASSSPPPSSLPAQQPPATHGEVRVLPCRAALCLASPADPLLPGPRLYLPLLRMRPTAMAAVPPRPQRRHAQAGRAQPPGRGWREAAPGLGREEPVGQAGRESESWRQLAPELLRSAVAVPCTAPPRTSASLRCGPGSAVAEPFGLGGRRVGPALPGQEALHLRLPLEPCACWSSFWRSRVCSDIRSCHIFESIGFF